MVEFEPPTPEWPGALDRAEYHDGLVSAIDANADAAKRGDWADVLPKKGLVNRWRLGGSSWFTPLHQAAWLGAPVEVAQALIQAGAWRSLRTAAGQNAQEIATDRGHGHLVELLAPPAYGPVDADVRAALDTHLAAVIEARVRPALSVNLRPLPTELLQELPGRKLWFPVPGMYGGFSVELRRSYLHVESWCRVVGGSGQAHVITAQGATLVEDGFG